MKDALAVVGGVVVAVVGTLVLFGIYAMLRGALAAMEDFPHLFKRRRRK